MPAAVSATGAQVTAFRLAGHHLDRRLGPDGLATAAGACGLQDTPPGSAALALLARVDGLSPERLEAAVSAERSLVLVWSLRLSPCLVPSADLAVFTTGALPDDEDALLAAMPGPAAGRRAFALVAAELADVEVDGRPAGSVLAADAERLTDPAGPVAGVRLLPPSDPLLGLRDRASLVADKALAKRLWTALGRPGALLVDGRVAGTWRQRKAGPGLTVTVAPFAPLAAGTAAAVEAEAAAMAPFRGARRVDVAVEP
jgi:hypothetical protein